MADEWQGMQEVATNHRRAFEHHHWCAMFKKMCGTKSVSAHASHMVSAIDYPDQNYNNSNNEQHVNKAAHSVRSYKSQYPQDEHNNGNGIENDFDLSLVRRIQL